MPFYLFGRQLESFLREVRRPADIEIQENARHVRQYIKMRDGCAGKDTDSAETAGILLF